MPTTSMRRLVSPLRRSNGLVEYSSAQWAAGEAHAGQDVGHSRVHQNDPPGNLGPTLISLRLGILVREGDLQRGQVADLIVISADNVYEVTGALRKYAVQGLSVPTKAQKRQVKIRFWVFLFSKNSFTLNIKK
ncbi:hypothetical protein HPY23_11735 [Methylobacterium sp. IF7SW-B2]|jgi:hypothetical protein|nr:hypothetical protein [Methylobacterium ajmalii]MBK3411729.1 hypothetical protein [Methylobacterium ajmalii]